MQSADGIEIIDLPSRKDLLCSDCGRASVLETFH